MAHLAVRQVSISTGRTASAYGPPSQIPVFRRTTRRLAAACPRVHQPDLELPEELVAS